MASLPPWSSDRLLNGRERTEPAFISAQTSSRDPLAVESRLNAPQLFRTPVTPVVGSPSNQPPVVVNDPKCEIAHRAKPFTQGRQVVIECVGMQLLKVVKIVHVGLPESC